MKVERLNHVEPKITKASHGKSIYNGQRTPPCWQTEFEQSHNSVRIPGEAVEIESRWNPKHHKIAEEVAKECDAHVIK